MHTTEFDLHLPPFELERGARLVELVLRGWMSEPAEPSWLPSTWTTRVAPRTSEREQQHVRPVGPPADMDERVSAPERPTILVVHALTGDMRVGGSSGWWEPVVGDGRAIDTGRYRVLCFNNLGSCYGSSGPDDPLFPAADPGSDGGVGAPASTSAAQQPELANALPPTVTTWDQARAILAALDTMGIEQVDLLVGGSVGGMIVLCLTALAPERFRRVMPIASSAAASPWIIGFNHIGRQCILANPGPRGLELARQIAHMTYRAEPGLVQRQGRSTAAPDGCDLSAPYRVQTYLEYQGAKLVQRFSSRAYVCQLGAMDHHDLERAPRWADAAFACHEPWGVHRLQTQLFCVGIDSDALYLPTQMRSLAVQARTAGITASYLEIHSPHGHDGFLIEWDQLNQLLRSVLQTPAG